MKLTFVIDSLALGGAQKHVCQMATGLAARGHRVQVIGLNDVSHPAMLAPLTAAGIPVTIIGRRAMLCGPGFWRLCRQLRAGRPEVVVTVLFASTVAGRLAARFAGMKRVVTCIQARNINYRWWQFALLRATSGSTSRFLCNSRAAMTFAGQHEGARTERSHFVANGVANAGGAMSAGRSWADLGLPFKPDDEVIATIGRLDPQKGYTGLLRAFALVLPQCGRARLLLIGGGPQEAELRALSRELGLTARVVFAGERPDAAEAIRPARLYVQPSRFEGTPNALMEAMAAGLPSIASAVDGIPELISDGVTGRLVPPDDPALLAKAIVASLQDPDRTAAIGRQGQRAMTEQFTVTRMIDAYEKHFLELANE